MPPEQVIKSQHIIAPVTLYHLKNADYKIIHCRCWTLTFDFNMYNSINNFRVLTVSSRKYTQWNGLFCQRPLNWAPFNWNLMSFFLDKLPIKLHNYINNDTG